MVSHHPTKFGDHRHCGSGDIMFLVAEEENSRCSRFNPPLMFISKGHGLKESTRHILLTPILVSHSLKAVIGQNFEK